MHRQNGMVLMMMLIIVILGAAAVLVGALRSAAVQIDRNKTAANLLALAREVAIGNIVGGLGGQSPGNTLRPDSFSSTESPYNYDGSADGGCFDASKGSSSPVAGLPLIGSGANMRCLGRLPWKELSLSIGTPSENDPYGIMPWYAVSANLVDPANVTFNSELLNASPPLHPWLTVRDMNGNVLSNRVAFIVIIPGPALSGQSRTRSPNLGGPSQYLDSIAVPAACTAPCVPGTYKNYDLDDDYIIGDDSNPQFNDKLIYVTIDTLMPLVEKRIGREVKGCLDGYASNNAGQYPWAAPVSDVTNYDGVSNTLFGRLPATSPTPSATVQQLLNLLAALQTALNNYKNGNNYKTQAYIDAMLQAGNNLASYASTQTPATAAPLDQASLNQAYNAGTSVVNPNPQTSWTNKQASDLVKNAQKQIDQASTFFDSKNHGSLGSSKFIVGWPSNCTLFSSAYWPDWRNLVFYQIATGYAPSGSGSCGGTCLTVNGSANTVGSNGTYHAVVAMAGKILSGTRIPSSIANYLEGTQAGRTNPPSSTIFDSYKTLDANYQTDNDLALCLDGGVNCR